MSIIFLFIDYEVLELSLTKLDDGNTTFLLRQEVYAEMSDYWGSHHNVAASAMAIKVKIRP